MSIEQTSAMIFIAILLCIPVIIAALINLPRLEDWYRDLRGKMPQREGDDVEDYIKEVEERRREEEDASNSH